MHEIRGRCKKEISIMMPTFTDRSDFVREYKINIDDDVGIDRDSTMGDKEYYVMIHYKKHYMNREEVEEHFEIIWEHGCYNTCIRNGIPCNKIGHHLTEGVTDRSKYWSNCCRIGWEIGRCACFMYEQEA